MIRRLTAKETEQVYHTHLEQDFPPEERRPLKWVQALSEQGRYLTVGYFSDEGVLKGYAFFGRSSTEKTLMMDYFAVVKVFRESGVGSAFFQELKEVFSDYCGIVYEVEAPEKALTEADHAMRERRICFYLRNGGCMTRVYSRVFGVDYQMMYIPIHGEWDDDFVAAELEDAYRVMIPPERYDMIIEDIGINENN
ncbi:MAG: hypothetical protein IJZ85_03950 [Lachnospiraceae bacterium]|nr:hypothetical protein [Lachnospiraceae bacterium]